MNNLVKIWKLAHSHLGDKYSKALDDNIATIGKNTGAKGRSKKTQADNFQNAKIGDYFFLLRSSAEVELIGRFIDNEIFDTEELHDDYFGRKYKKVFDATNRKINYSGKWWAPSDNSTFIEVPVDDYLELEEKILRPNFGITLDRLDVSVNRKNENEQNKENDMSNSPKQTQPLNQILYGPPGTGKTYNTINKAIEIIDKDFYEKHKSETPENRKALKAKFEEYKKAGQIEFVTFHQSYGYEEFVEGIKAKTTDKGIEYKIEDGIFKMLCEKAQNKEVFSIGQTIGKYRIVSLTNELMKLKRENGSLIPIPMYLLNEVLDLIDKEIISIDDINNKVAIEKMSIESEKFIMNGYPNVFRDLALFHIENRKLKNNINQNHILIIDEINRGNISKIYGELITLIEPSKRIGADEEIKVKLPYSNDDFGVPQNLYIIGTMNTADRSIALMDTALRRRFEFVEMLPNPNLLKDEDGNDLIVDDINIKSMLEKINKRVEYLYDRDHTIGHAYFMSLKDTPTLDELENIFKNKIIPLLSEYFYDDWEKILMVLGKDGFIEKTDIESTIFSYTNDDYIEEKQSMYKIKQEFDFREFKNDN